MLNHACYKFSTIRHSVGRAYHPVQTRDTFNYLTDLFQQLALYESLHQNFQHSTNLSRVRINANCSQIPELHTLKKKKQDLITLLTACLFLTAHLHAIQNTAGAKALRSAPRFSVHRTIHEVLGLSHGNTPTRCLLELVHAKIFKFPNVTTNHVTSRYCLISEGRETKTVQNPQQLADMSI